MPAAATTPRKPHDPFDPDYLRAIIEKAFAPLIDHWFRARLIGAHRLPDHGPALLAPNHSGSAFPFDGLVLDALLWRRDAYRPERKFRSVYEKELAVTWWMRPFGVDNFWRRGAGIDATFDNFHEVLARGDRVIYYPEGVPGIGKGFAHRYRLQRFSTSFVIHCARNRAPVFPVYIINAEWVNPFNFTLKPLDWLMHKLFHVPFLPLPSAILGILWPWAWYLALPCHLVFVVGEPIDVAERAHEKGIRRFDRSERPLLQEVAEEIKRDMQVDLDRHVKRYGRWPYQSRSLRRALWKERRRVLSILPTGWAWQFVRAHRDRERPPARNRLHSILRDWDILGFYLPLGWPLLSLTRGLRRPPYGYRGLSAEQRRRREGAYRWDLAERPLPPR